jgi:hypothetical protein
MRNRGAAGPPANYQTARLARGRHSSPEEGVCVMELASLLAHEPFSDHPQAVCPVIGAFLRAYNDRLDDHWRQDLYPYAAKVVGTRNPAVVERRRAQMCRERARRMKVRGGLPEEPVGQPRQPGRLRGWLQSYWHPPVHAGHHAGVTFGRVEVGYGGVLKLDYELHRVALRFVDELIAVGGDDELRLAEPQAARVESTPAWTWSLDRDFDPQGG